MNDFLASLVRVWRASLGALAQIAQGRTGGVAGILLGVGVALGVASGLTWALQDPDGATPEATEGHFFEIGTGSVTGTYYPLGNTIMGIIANPAGSVRCSEEARCGPPGLIPVVQQTEGSVANINAIHNRRLDSAFAQSNTLYQAANGIAPFSVAYTDLRAISGLYQETVHLVVARESGITQLSDLRGKRVSIDRAGSGTYGIALSILSAAGIRERDLTIETTPVDQSAEQLLSGEIDAFFFVAGPPVRAVASLAEFHLINLIPIEGEAIDRLLESQPYLSHATIPGGSYLDIDDDVPTIGVTAVWIVHRTADYDLVYRITRALWNPVNRPALTRGPASATFMTPETAIQGVPIPFHPGAEHYYREIGLLTDD